ELVVTGGAGDPAQLAVAKLETGRQRAVGQRELVRPQPAYRVEAGLIRFVHDRFRQVGPEQAQGLARGGELAGTGRQRRQQDGNAEQSDRVPGGGEPGTKSTARRAAGDVGRRGRGLVGRRRRPHWLVLASPEARWKVISSCGRMRFRLPPDVTLPHTALHVERDARSRYDFPDDAFTVGGRLLEVDL